MQPGLRVCRTLKEHGGSRNLCEVAEKSNRAPNSKPLKSLRATKVHAASKPWWKASCDEMLKIRVQLQIPGD